MATPYRTALLRVRVDGVNVIRLRISNAKALAFTAQLKKCRQLFDIKHDDDVADLLIAVLQHEVASCQPPQSP
jgi:hypothetical protein